MKLYLVEVIDDEARRRLCEVCELTDKVEEAEIAIDRNYKIDQNWINQAKNLKCIAIHGTGISDVDIAYAKSKGIVCFNSPYQNAESVAELNIALALMAARKIHKALAKERQMKELSGLELEGKNAGFIGFGHIAEKTAAILRNGFGMNVLAYNRSQKQVSGVAFLPLEEVLKKSDILFLGTALTVGTYHILNTKNMPLLKNGVILVNTARGALVDEKLLKEYLSLGRVSCYATDVLEHEPIREDEPLLLENVIILPHIGANTTDALYAVGKLMTDQIIEFILGHTPKYKL